jgi:hydrogenase-4 component E
VSGGITLVLKVILIPWMLHRMIRKLNVRWDIETLLNVPTTMLVGIALVIFSFSLALPVSRLSSSLAGGSLGIALSCVMLSFLMLITRSKAVPQVIGFLSMENGLIFAATAVTNGMPMIVEFGIALDVLVGVLILGVFMFQIREKFDTLDIQHLEKLKED